MLAAALILILTFFIVFFVPNYNERSEAEETDDTRKTPQIKKLWGLAQAAMKERKPLKAEKALLTILKFDEKNAAAYNRLGILYAKEKHFKEAVECFEIAQSLDNNASSLHNVGLIYFETGKYEKAAMAFSQAIEIEGDQPGRYIAYAKALEKLGERSKAIEALETAYSLNPSTVILRHMLEIYENSNDTESAEHVRERIEKLQIEKAATETKAKPAKRIIRRTNKSTKTTKTTEAKPKTKRTRIIVGSKTKQNTANPSKELPKKHKII
jgi:tetratricopeptide (TPR) repeat protein